MKSGAAFQAGAPGLKARPTVCGRGPLKLRGLKARPGVPGMGRIWKEARGKPSTAGTRTGSEAGCGRREGKDSAPHTGARAPLSTDCRPLSGGAVGGGVLAHGTSLPPDRERSARLGQRHATARELTPFLSRLGSPARRAVASQWLPAHWGYAMGSRESRNPEFRGYVACPRNSRSRHVTMVP